MEELKLEFVQILTRHGFRTPITLIPHDKDSWECERFVKFAKHFKSLTYGIPLCSNLFTLKVEIN